MNADKLAQLRELFETWLASRPSFRTTVEVRAAWEGWKANTAVAAMLAAHDAQPAQADKTLIVNMDQAAAWRAVADALTEVAPGWLRGDGTGMECAVATIKRLAKPAQAVQPKIGDFDARDSFSMQTDATTLQRNAAQPVGVPEVFALLEIFQSWIGPRRPDKNDDNRDLWDRVAAVLAAAPQPPAQPCVIAPSVQTLPLKSASYEMTTTAQPSADAEDAARYRWLLEHGRMFSAPECDGLNLPITFSSLNDFSLTKAIDTAIAAEGGE